MPNVRGKNPKRENNLGRPKPDNHYEQWFYKDGLALLNDSITTGIDGPSDLLPFFNSAHAEIPSSTIPVHNTRIHVCLGVHQMALILLRCRTRSPSLFFTAKPFMFNV